MKIAQENNRPGSVSAPKNDAKNWKCRLLVVLPLAILLLGPTPGAVGSCSQDAEDNPVLSTRDDLIDYCQQKNQLIYYRQFLREEIDEDEYTKCRHFAIDRCEMSSWRSDCRPTRRQADACLRALSATDTIDIDESEIKECDICNAERDGPEPSDLDAGDESCSLR